ncbi:MAG: hypothetical protein JWM59_4210 [Verrucomicrobiales bacterium]|nr:hypothetical protein [Verrucomicrobiales bacterium]
MRDDLVEAGLLPVSWRAAWQQWTDNDRPESGSGGAKAGISTLSAQPGGKKAGDPSLGAFGVRGIPGQSTKVDNGEGRETADQKQAAGRTGLEMKEWAGRIVALKGSPQLEAELEEFMIQLTPDNWREAIDTALPLYDFLHPDKWGALMMRVGAVGGEASARHFRPDNELVDYEGFGSRNVVRGWAAVDRAAAQAFVESLPEGRYRDGMGIGFLWGIDEASVASLDKLYDRLPKGLWPQIAAAQRDMARWESAGPESGVEGWLARTEAEFGRDSERFRVAQETADLHFLEGAMWDKDSGKVENLTNEYLNRSGKLTTDRVLRTALTSLGQLDPVKSLDLVLANLSTHPVLGSSVPMIMTDWTKRDTGAPGNWLNANQDAPVYDKAAAYYAWGIKKEDPAAAKAWAGTIKSASLQVMVLKGMPGRLK